MELSEKHKYSRGPWYGYPMASMAVKHRSPPSQVEDFANEYRVDKGKEEQGKATENMLALLASSLDYEHRIIEPPGCKRS